MGKVNCKKVEPKVLDKVFVKHNEKWEIINKQIEILGKFLGCKSARQEIVILVDVWNSKFTTFSHNGKKYIMIGEEVFEQLQVAV